jgi:3,4-dihydroxy 2-butanone 4-phosphate synthase/GTP cyclohydrolase II
LADNERHLMPFGALTICKAGRTHKSALRENADGRIDTTTRLRLRNALQDTGLDTVDANFELGLSVDARDYTVSARILQDLGISSMRLLSNNPAKYQGIADFGLRVVERLSLQTPPTEENRGCLLTKQRRLGHALGVAGETVAD